MSHALVTCRASSSHMRLNRAFGLAGSFSLAAVTAFVVTLSAFVESFNSARLGAVMTVLFIVHLVRFPRFVFTREFSLYAFFVLYMVVVLLWTSDIRLAMNTLVPAITFILILTMFGALVAYHNLQAVLAGTLCGILAGAAVYTRATGFPFVYPADFSYNAIAGMYLSGLFVTLLLICYKRSKVLLVIIGSIFILHILATTSIKFNLGILLGLTAASLMHFKRAIKVLWRNALALSLLTGMLGYVAASNEAFMEVFSRGIHRVSLGIEILQARENVAGYSAFEERARWQRDGLSGWMQNPLFGHGVEAFRNDFGSTSHSTPVDLLYNVGLLGFVLFYAAALSIIWRSLRSQRRGGVQMLIFGASTCYLFVSLSAPLHYNAFFAVFIALSSTLLGRRSDQTGHSAHSGAVRE